MSLQTDLLTNANALLASLTARYSEEYGLGTMSPSIYDTAWVALVSRPSSDKSMREWVFPESFDYIYRSQGSNGSWEGDGSVVDAVINTLACLLVLLRHQHDAQVKHEVGPRIEKAVAFLKDNLARWDVFSTERIALEVIVPNLLELLEKEGGEAFHFDFPQRQDLYDLNKKKLAKLNLEIVYKVHTTLLHSLEAFVGGKLDFDRVKHLKRNGSFMANPASTAAYLMEATEWDEEAEAYLRHVIAQCKHYGFGCVCNVWPTTVFEFAWSVCNLVENGFDVARLDKTALDRIKDILSKALDNEKGIIGFAPHVGPDSDDTAKAIAALNYLGVPYSHDSLCKAFELPTHFQCFQHERNPSLSANCNVLISLLRAADPGKYETQIVKAATFITEEWWVTEGIMTDKWHLSQWYPIMLAAQGLLYLLKLHGEGLFSLSENLLTVKIPVTLFQMLIRILQQQRKDGSWGVSGSREETAYAVIALANLSSLPYSSLILDQIRAAVDKGREYLTSKWVPGDLTVNMQDYIWVGKIGYGVEHVCNSYVISAMHVPLPLYSSDSVSAGATPINAKAVEKFLKFYARLPMFQGFPAWRLRAWLIEGYLYLPELARVRLEVFDREGMKDDPYFEYLPFSWTGPNGMEECYASAQTIFDMIVISMVNFQVDEFFDIIVQKHGEGALTMVRTILQKMFADLDVGVLPKSLANVNLNGTKTAAKDEYDHTYRDIHARLAHFVNYVFTHPRIELASENDKGQLRREMNLYLNAHTTQCEDNVRLQAQESADLFLTPRSSYLKWVRSTAADHLSSQYAFALITCLLGHSQNKQTGRTDDYFPTSEIKYIALDCATHLSVICRIYNDYGSIPRDRTEKNLNATFFPEFEAKAKGKSIEALRKELAMICNYERKCLQVSFDEMLRVSTEKLGPERGKKLYDTVRLFYNASEIYTEIYEWRDISTWN